VPQKSKTYDGVIFSQEVIRGAVDNLMTGLPKRERKPDFEAFVIKFPRERLKYDNEEEFFGDYVKGFEYAVFEKTYSHDGRVKLWVDGQLSKSSPKTEIDIGAPSKLYVEKVFNIFESNVEKCRLPELPAKKGLDVETHEMRASTKVTIVPFVAMSFDEKDDNLNRYVTNILRALGIDFETGERYSKDSIPEKVRNRIIDAALFIVIFVKRDKIEGGGYTTPSWLLKELGIAQGSQKDVIAWVERGIKDIAGLDYEKEAIYFERDSVEEMGKATMKFLEALKEHKVI
jgi:hypothetical protein